MNKYLLSVLVVILPFGGVSAVNTVSVFTSANGGAHIFETGTKYYNLSGITGGSRISYARKFESLGVAASGSLNNWNILGSFSSTPGFVNSGGGKGRGFFLVFSFDRKRY